MTRPICDVSGCEEVATSECDDDGPVWLCPAHVCDRCRPLWKGLP